MNTESASSSQPDVNERMRRAEQLAFAGALAGGLIHEIKNPLNSLNLNLQLLAEEWREAESPRDRRALKRILALQEETRRLADILDDFMNFVRGHSLTITECDANKLVDEVALFLRPELESEHIELRVSYDNLPAVRLDVNLIKQALLNLLLNASQAMEEGKPREIILRTAAEEKGFRVDVIDTGRGIPEADLPRLFEAFYSTRKNGTGLGLPAARRIVEEHGGRITVHSEVGRGSCFSMHLPFNAAEHHDPSVRREGAA